jgi:hypothetical protein
MLRLRRRGNGDGIARDSRYSRYSSRQLGFESLEGRRLMAVGTSLDSATGNLSITGDSAPDDIEIVGTALAGELRVSGRNGTLVNGVPNGSATVPGVTGSLIVQLNGGNDVITVDNVYLAGSLSITTGDGDDTIHLAARHPVSPALDLTIGPGPGNDLITQQNYGVLVGRDNIMLIVGGNDNVQLVGASARGRIIINGGDGNDTLLGVGVTATTQMLLAGGHGANAISLLNSSAHSLQVSTHYDGTIAGSVGDNTIYLDTIFVQTEMRVTAHANAPAAADSPVTSISVLRSIAAAVFVEGGYGENRVTIYGNQINGPAYEVTPGVGPTITPRIEYQGLDLGPTAPVDRIDMNYNLTERVSIATSRGDDMLSLVGNRFTISTTLDGGEGQNFWSELGNVLGTLTVRDFTAGPPPN